MVQEYIKIHNNKEEREKQISKIPIDEIRKDNAIMLNHTLRGKKIPPDLLKKYNPNYYGDLDNTNFPQNIAETTIEHNLTKSNLTNIYIKTLNNNLSNYVQKSIIEGIDLSDGLNRAEIAILKRQPDEKIKSIEINNYTKIDEILNNGFNGATKSDIALFQIYAKQNGTYLKSENRNYKVDGILGKGTKNARNDLQF